MKKNYIKYTLALLLFGSNGIVASRILLNSYEIVFLRTLIGSMFLLIMYKAAGRKFTFTKQKKDFLFIALSGISMGASWMCLYEAYSRVGVGTATLLYYFGPVIVMILSPLFFKEKLTRAVICGFIIVVIGMLLINGVGSDGNITSGGFIIGIMSACTYSLMVIFNKKSKHITGMENAVIQLTVSFVTVAAFLLLKQGAAINTAGIDFAAVLLLGTVNTGLGCYMYFSALPELPVRSVAVLGYLEPLSAVLLSALLLSEAMTPLQAVGAVFIIGGALLGELSKQKQI